METKCPSTVEWVIKIWYILMREYYLAIKRNEVMIHATTWMDIENIILSKINSTQRNKCCDSTYMKYLKLLTS